MSPSSGSNLYGNLDLLVLRTLQVEGSVHGLGVLAGEPYTLTVGFPPGGPGRVEAALDESGAVRLTWAAEYYSIGGYQVEVDGVAVGVAFEPRAVLTDLEPGVTYTLGVREVWYDGTVGEDVAEITFTVPG